MTQLPIVIVGAGGHGKVLLSLLQAAGREVTGVCDPAIAATGAKTWRGVKVLGDDSTLEGVDPATVALVNGVGRVVDGEPRAALFRRLRSMGFRFPELVHPYAWVDATVTLGEGAQVMAGVVIQPDVSVGENTIVNTGARIDHDCKIASHVHIAPGAVLCGNVEVGEGALVGAGATIIQGRVVGARGVVGAGAVLVRDLPPGETVVGSPARPRAEGEPA